MLIFRSFGRKIALQQQANKQQQQQQHSSIAA
jgi:hypothetical protein